MHLRVLQWKLSERAQMCIYAFKSLSKLVEHSYILLCNSALSLILMYYRYKHCRRGVDEEKLDEIKKYPERSHRIKKKLKSEMTEWVS